MAMNITSDVMLIYFADTQKVLGLQIIIDDFKKTLFLVMKQMPLRFQDIEYGKRNRKDKCMGGSRP